MGGGGGGGWEMSMAFVESVNEACVCTVKCVMFFFMCLSFSMMSSLILFVWRDCGWIA